MLLAPAMYTVSTTLPFSSTLQEIYQSVLRVVPHIIVPFPWAIG